MQGCKRSGQRGANLFHGDAGRSRQLAQLVAIRVRDDRNMHVIGGRVAQQLLQPDLAGRGVHDVDAPDDFGYALHCIVDDHGQLIGNEPVAAADHEIP